MPQTTSIDDEDMTDRRDLVTDEQGRIRSDNTQPVVEKVLRERAIKTLSEVRHCYPEAILEIETTRSRGILTACEDRCVISKEFVETEESISSPNRLQEYYSVLRGKARLVLIVPKAKAAETFARMLDFNQVWLSYYQIYYYDEKGQVGSMNRRAWCEMTGRYYDPPSRLLEII